jgi:hypothetical protein
MQIIKTTMIAILAVFALMGVQQQTAFASSDVFKVKVILDGVDSQTGPLDVEVTGADDTTVSKSVDPFKDGHAGVVDIGTFVLPAKSTEEGEFFEVCVFSQEDEDVYVCKNGVNTEKNAAETIRIETPTGIDKSISGRVYHPEPTYYNGDGHIIPVQDNDVTNQGDDSVNTETTKEQDSGVTVTFGDDSDNNNVEIDQRTTFADVIKDVLPYATKAGSIAKNTAVEILN